MLEMNKVGNIHIPDNGRMIVGDSCYYRHGNLQDVAAVDLPAGNYTILVYKLVNDPIPYMNGLISGALVVHESILDGIWNGDYDPFEEEESNHWIITTDAGHVAFVTEEVYQNWDDDKHYEHMVESIFNDTLCGQNELGIAVTSGIGDGIYALFQSADKKALGVSFIDTSTDEE